MLLLYEDHAVVGKELAAFEATCRDQLVPLLASSTGGRLLWYFDRLLGQAHHVVTVCALADGEALERYADGVASGKLADVVEELDRLRYGVTGTILRPTPWSPPVDLEAVPDAATAGEAAVFLENVAWPDEPMRAFSAQLGASYERLWSGTSGSTPPVELVLAAHGIPPGPGQQMTVLQRANDPLGFLGNVVVKLPPDHPIEQAKAHGLEHRDRFASNLLMAAEWSPCH
ncbi:MAG: hypothetical protein ACYCU7_05595 [Acidimicrobiales bacterium]